MDQLIDQEVTLSWVVTMPTGRMVTTKSTSGINTPVEISEKAVLKEAKRVYGVHPTTISLLD